MAAKKKVRGKKTGRVKKRVPAPLWAKADKTAQRSNGRKRRTKAEMERLRESIYDICDKHRPLTIRNLFYRMVVAQLIAKLQKEYKNVVVRLTGEMRESGVLPWNWIVDSTRWMRKPNTHRSLKAALQETQDFYRRDVWADQGTYIEVWCESSSLAGIIASVTERWDVPLMPCGGFSSKTFLWEAARNIEAQDKPAKVIYVGDWDPSGKCIGEAVEASLCRYAPDSDIEFKRLAITPQQVEQYNLPSSPFKKSTHSKNWEGGAVEAEALDHTILCDDLENEITSYLDWKRLKKLQDVEKAEIETIGHFIETLD